MNNMNEISETPILKFMREKRPDIIVKAPARINLINPLDAVEADYWAPAMAISGEQNPLSAYCYIKSYPYEVQHSKFSIFYSPNDDPEEIILDKEIIFKIDDLIDKKNLSDEQQSDIFLGALMYLFDKIPEFKKVLREQAIQFGVFTSIPRQSGVGGSSALIISVLWAIGCYCRLDTRDPQGFSNFPFNRDVMAEISTEIENNILENTAGFGDRYTISRGGIGFTSYVGKLHHPLIGEGPMAVYDRIDLNYCINDIPIILAYSGVTHKSGDVHKIMRNKYLSGDKTMHKLYEELSVISWKSRYALMKHDWKNLGKYFTENAEISEKIMKHCGFKFGIGWANKILIDLIVDNPEVYAVKLSGAGGGGSVFALVNRDAKDRITNLWKEKLNKVIENPEEIQKKFPEISINDILQLKNAKFYQIRINTKGVTQLKIQ